MLHMREEEDLFQPCHLLETESYEEDFPATMPGRLSAHDLIVCLSGSILIHMGALLLNFMPPLFNVPPAQPSYITVNFITPGDLGGGGQTGAGPAGVSSPEGSSSSAATSCDPKEGTPAANDVNPLSPFPTQEKVSEPKAVEAQIAKEPLAPQPVQVAEPIKPAKPIKKVVKPQPRLASARVQKASNPERRNEPEELDEKCSQPPARHVNEASSTLAGQGSEALSTSGKGQGDGSGLGHSESEEGGQGSGGGSGGGHSIGHGQSGGSAGEFQLGAVDEPPKVTNKVEPSYPLSARRRNLSGKVVVKFLVTPQGQPTKPSILESSPQGVFDECVIEAVIKWRFKPGIYRGKAVSTWMVVPIQFKLG